MTEIRTKPLYHSVRIGKVELEGNLFLAPVAGYSDRAFRSICWDKGASFTYTEMISAEALSRGSEKTALLMRRAHNETAYGVQIFGGSPGVMEQAARIVREQAKPSLIDINAGCPVPKIVKSGAGSGLTRDPETLFTVTRAVVQAASPLPVTVKIRSGWDAANLTWKEAALAAIEAGAAAITLHPRTRAQGYEGKADWHLLTELTRVIRDKSGAVPVFGSGDVFSPEAAKAMLEQTGVDGVLFARGALGNPFIFRDTRELLETGAYAPMDSAEQIAAGLKELTLLIADTGERRACREMRKRFCAYVKGLPDAASLRNALVACETESDYRKLLK
ncbi:MAG: tRNA dihydrouridine synthase DusB [Treponema sp.]|jgi:nifR3 family TIM-barrel protein|nr:tRNA dihydrouridine synthase DusB [Treponema sp.]